MSAPKKSTRPRSRTRKVEDEAKINSGSTRSIDGLNMSERAARDKKKPTDNSTGSLDAAATTLPSGTSRLQQRKAARTLTAKQKKLDKNNDGKISGADFKKMKGGGRAKAKGYAVGGKVTRPQMRPKNLGESGSEKAFRILSESGFVSDADKLKMKKMMGDMESPTPPSQTPQPKPPSRQNGQKPRSGELNKPLSDKDIKYLDQMMQRHMAKGGKYQFGDAVKDKGMAMGGKIKSKGMAMGGKVMSKGYAMGGKVRSKGKATGGAGFGAARFSGKGTQIF